MPCPRCTFEIAYAMATGGGEPFQKITNAQRKAARAMIERAGLKIPEKNESPV